MAIQTSDNTVKRFLVHDLDEYARSLSEIAFATVDPSPMARADALGRLRLGPFVFRPSMDIRCTGGKHSALRSIFDLITVTFECIP
jgi:hypothetical protein